MNSLNNQNICFHINEKLLTLLKITYQIKDLEDVIKRNLPLKEKLKKCKNIKAVREVLTNANIINHLSESDLIITYKNKTLQETSNKITKFILGIKTPKTITIEAKKESLYFKGTVKLNINK
ncbi:hypothetical protein [Candidatus Phytoplasma meliae]|uniref:Uncharacterized protein n=1 Tax=Candidatus Phytoplasma meliae TaxID=1848402 RepID=A0ABS5CXE4_9MOLU|nr:hypothetical protein [Candidatus Phytoplasma meliae]MBP5835643.1 hypothetical protein [Candidatus Phytoplasma meliae]